jgi:hypothetical protein
MPMTRTSPYLLKCPLLILWAAMLAWGPAVLAGPLQDGYQARYTVTRNSLPLGESVRVLRPLGDGLWQFDARTAPTGLVALFFSDVIEEHSRLRRQDRQVRPLHYSYRRHGGRKERAYALGFDWQAGLLHFEHNGQQLPLTPGTQDPLSFVVAVMQHLHDGDKTFTLTIAGRKKVRDYRVHAADEITMNTALGRQPVIHVQAQEVGEDTRYDLWCLSRHDYLPLRIRQQRNDEITELRLLDLAVPPPIVNSP